MSNQLEDQMALISQLYPGMYSQIVVPPQETKPRRRRKKSKAGETSMMKKRKLSQEQVNLLEQNFGDEHKLESERKDRLASELGLDPRQVAVWFQNRRARWKNKKVEEEYSKLKSLHESTILDKCRLESEVLQLKQQLSEAEKEIQRLSSSSSSSSSMDPRGGDAVSSNSPISSSVSMDATDPPAPNFIGELGDEDLLMSYMAAAENSYIIHGMEWLNPYM